jgi:hypothetical protein
VELGLETIIPLEEVGKSTSSELDIGSDDVEVDALVDIEEISVNEKEIVEE